MKAKKRNWFSKLTDIFFRPKYFFSRIVADGKIEDAILKAFLWGFVGGLIVLIMNLYRGDAFTIFSLFKAIVMYPVLAVLLLFSAAGLMMLVSEITGGERDWEIAVKGIASIFFVYPLALLLNTLAFDCTSMWLTSILIDIYLLFLIYNIAVYCLHGKKISVLFIIMVGAMLLAAVYMSNYRTVWFLVKNIPATLTCFA
ncbi:MAG: hypothetical protein IKN73_02675 [Alphaproteobacteria bacterium]|nr:hypothetical protein [Alphaproteobacteria bacterium]